MIRKLDQQLPRLLRARPRLCLTYDDGPGPGTTPALLELLKAHGVHATFFLLGCRAEAAPVVADAVRDAGHEVACHSWGHLHAWKAPPWRVARDIERGFVSLEPWLSPSGLFRPPYGKMTPMTWLQVRRRGARLAWWTLDSGDTHPVLPPIDEVTARAAGGGVVLMHDFDREGADRDARRAFVLTLTEQLILKARREGLEIITFGRLLETGKPPCPA
jgi:peptidoglycan/xylan/chitin deacetylase (PgdA/CDA1 family)